MRRHMQMHTYTYTYTYIYIYIYIYICTTTRVHRSIHTDAQTHAHAYIHIAASMSIFVSKRMISCPLSCPMFKHTHTHNIYIYIYTYIHTHKCTCIQTYSSIYVKFRVKKDDLLSFELPCAQTHKHVSIYSRSKYIYTYMHMNTDL